MPKKKTTLHDNVVVFISRRDAETLCLSKMMRQVVFWTFTMCVVFENFRIGIRAQDLMCCSHTTGSCRSVCERISLVQLAANIEIRNQTVIEVQTYCSNQLVAFWECLNATLKDISRGDYWPGRTCCSIPHSETCRIACVTATSVDDLDRSCRKSDEIPFFSCLERQQMGENCCSSAREAACLEACRNIFNSQLTPNKYKRQRLKEECESNSPSVMECVKDIVKVTPVTDNQERNHCCEKSNNIRCIDTCNKLSLTEISSQEEMFDVLRKSGCGEPLPQNHFWQCFLQSTGSRTVLASATISRIERVGMDSAKWHCCSHANSTDCLRLCTKTFSNSWAKSFNNFHAKCLKSINEEGLINCIDEVDEPCELGCDGLSFCTNFNNRPTELFRSCNTQADEAARSDFTLWQSQNRIQLPILNVPLRNVDNCANMLKAIACNFQIKPCASHSHANQICRDACLNIYSQCVDWTQISPVYSAESICQTLSPDDPDESCIRINEYLAPSTLVYPRFQGQVSSPCKGNPCDANEVCIINKSCIHGTNCQPYICQPGCKLGEVSQYMIPDGTYVRIPITNNTKGCLKISKCNKNKIEDHQPLPCFTFTPCPIANQRHGSSFNIDCNRCSCYAGEQICSKKQCEDTALGVRNTAYTTLPCNCPPHYVPVCGRNGVTYASACLAKCSELNDGDVVSQGPCQNPCKPNACAIGQKCVPKPQVCLSLRHKPCKQYECINGSVNCLTQPIMPVCDADNQQFENSCMLAHSNGKLGYWGPCLTKCSQRGQVCGINGKTYNSECAAFADMISIDYEGPCFTIGLITEAKSHRCANVKCPRLSNLDCLGITPPGACCPLCGGSLRILYSKDQIHRALYALQNQSADVVNLKSLLQGLDRHIQVAQCTLRGYLTIENDIFVTVQSTERVPSELQLEACVREAEKLASLIQMQSPRVTSELSLSSLTRATVVHTRYTVSAVSNVISNPVVTYLITITITLFGVSERIFS